MKDGYRDEDTILRDGALSKDAKKALLGVLKCENVKLYPSPDDLKFLNKQYSKPVILSNIYNIINSELTGDERACYGHL